MKPEALLEGFVGLRVRKFFKGHGIFGGHIVSMRRDADRVALFLVRYDDGNAPRPLQRPNSCSLAPRLTWQASLFSGQGTRKRSAKRSSSKCALRSARLRLRPLPPRPSTLRGKARHFPALLRSFRALCCAGT